MDSGSKKRVTVAIGDSFCFVLRKLNQTICMLTSRVDFQTLNIKSKC